MGRFVSNLFGGKIMTFNWFYVNDWLYIGLRRFEGDFNTGFSISFWNGNLEFRIVILGVLFIFETMFNWRRRK